ncbi:hypothetical protein FZEAL_9735 [Fusarium zealandicum]|uniref:Uncharacterized protein n=1 Tax=Fusarium zealandicum TaxID=1053134 RepID=A0A8H4U959_9HYPO|nr:hypothetical protein FZEAL_9735 [Fusarium zealandicum]
MGDGWDGSTARSRGSNTSTQLSNPAPVFKSPVSFCVLIFPSTYRESESQTQTVTETHEEVEIKPQQPQAGREGQYSSISATAELPPRGEQHFSEQEVRITREEEHYRRPGVQKYEQEQFTTIQEQRRGLRSLGFQDMALLSLPFTQATR